MKIKQLFTTPKGQILLVDEDGILYHLKDKNTPNVEAYEVTRVSLELVYADNGVLKKVMMT